MNRDFAGRSHKRRLAILDLGGSSIAAKLANVAMTFKSIAARAIFYLQIRRQISETDSAANEVLKPLLSLKTPIQDR